MALPDDLLDQPALAGARHVALHFLDEAADAYRRLAHDDDDPEALHDFRVGLRRLRSALRSYDAELDGAVRGRLRRRLRDVARATGGSRDAEVHVGWLDAQRASLGETEAAGAEYLAARLRAARRAADRELAADAVDRFPRLRRRLARALGSYTLTVRLDDPAAPETFAAATARLIDELAAELERHLAAVRSIADQEEAHEARIAGKRLRYAIEPVADRVEGAKAVVRQLRQLQDALGDLHDAHVFGGDLAAALAEADADAPEPPPADDTAATEPRADPPRDPRPGLRALEQRLESRGHAAFATAQGWVGGRGGALVTDVWRVAQRLAERGRAGVEIERKYLLRALPDVAARVAPIEIDQGYLPGERLVERLRRVRDHGKERFYRTVKLGSGVRRAEVEEETTRDVFEALWALTEGRRVRKHRHVVPDGALAWEVDDFADRALVLAEVELDHPDQAVEVPVWMAPLLVREVTDEPAYVNARLAR